MEGWVRNIKHGIVLPFMPDNKGGVCEENGEFIDCSMNSNTWLKLGGYYEHKTDYAQRKEKVIFLGYFYRQWGHFLIDCLGRSWILSDEAYNDYKVLLLTRNGNKINGNYARLLELMGVPLERLVDVSTPTIFEEIIIPQNVSWITEPELFFEPFSYAASNVKFTQGGGVPDKVYFSRQHFSDAKNKEIGEKLIQSQFELNGFEVMYPEKLSLDDQIRIVRKSEVVVCINGTIPLNYIFSDKGNTNELIVLNKTSIPHNNLKVICDYFKIKPHYLNVYSEPIKGHPKALGIGPFWMTFNEEISSYFDANQLRYELPKKYNLQLRIEHLQYNLKYIQIKCTRSIKNILRSIRNMILVRK